MCLLVNKLEKRLLGTIFEVDATTLTLVSVSQILKFMSLIKSATIQS